MIKDPSSKIGDVVERDQAVGRQSGDVERAAGEKSRDFGAEREGFEGSERESGREEMVVKEIDSWLAAIGEGCVGRSESEERERGGVRLKEPLMEVFSLMSWRE